MSIYRIFIHLLWLGIASQSASAHDFRPLLVRVTEGTSGRYQVNWQPSPVLNASDQPIVEISGAGCAKEHSEVMKDGMRSARYRCTDQKASKRLVLTYPNDNPSLPTLMNLTRADGTFVRTIGPPGEASIALPGPQTHALRASFYALIGFDHILRGVDHLLFLSVLWLVTGTGWSLIRALAGFTVGHSATLAMATAGIATPAVPLIESLIALSIVVVAAESLNTDRTTLAWRYPTAVSSLFGLLHGFGFAGYLRDVGLPKNDEISALLMFNVGVELGQIVFVGTVVLMGNLITRAAKVFPQAAARLNANTSTLESVRTPVAYASGSIAMFWFVDRLWNGLSSVSAIG